MVPDVRDSWPTTSREGSSPDVSLPRALDGGMGRVPMENFDELVEGNDLDLKLIAFAAEGEDRGRLVQRIELACLLSGSMAADSAVPNSLDGFALPVA